MAEQILFPIAEKIIGRLGSAVVTEIGSLWGVNDELDALEETISTIKAVLLDAEEKQVHSHQVRNWLERLGGPVREADDLTDEINTEALRQRVMSGNPVVKQVLAFFSASNPLAFRYKMGRRIRKIEKTLAAVSKDKNFHLDVRHEESQVVMGLRDETYSFVRQEEIVGRDEDRAKLVKLLLEGESDNNVDVNVNVSIIPIVGMGGLGKTTLAQCVFNDEKVQQHFDLKIWVCVSDVFDLKLIVQKIVKSSTNNNILGDIEMDQLQKDLRKVLERKKYLLVLDDVWNEEREKWRNLQDLIVSTGAEGSRVVVTTRSQTVAQITGTVQPYLLGILDEDKSWSLFKKMAFKQEQEPKDPNILGIGMAIAKKCGGIPLAIRTVGGTLCGKISDLEYWSSVDKDFSQILEGDILSKLKLSYDRLAPHLKHCFAYCRLFDKDFEIDVKTLVKLWMAQGFLNSSGPSHRCMENVGYSIFMDLFDRSFFQEAEIDEWGTIKTCKMHDLMHDLATKVAGSECVNFNTNQGHVEKNTQHVSYLEVDSPGQISSVLAQARKIRTILFTEIKGAGKLGESICDAVILSSKFLRTLDLQWSRLETVPSSIGKLKHLRYLDLSNNDDIKTLPDSITNLLNLQTLKLSGCGSLQELPRNIKKLVNLRHLEINNCYNLAHMPNGLGQLTNLQTLTWYVLSRSTVPLRSHSGELKELEGLNNLRGRLEISNLRHGKDALVESVSANLKEKQYLRSLSLSWKDSDVDNLNEATEACIVGYEMSLEGLKPHLNLRELYVQYYKGVNLSSWLPSLTNLVRLRLSSCTKCKHLFPMSQFHSLKELELSGLPSLEYITNENSDDNIFCSLLTLLPSLQKLWLNSLPNLKGWWKEYGVSGEENQHKLVPSFPRLTWLRIIHCPNLTCMPLYPHLEDELTLEKTSLKPFQQTILESTPSTTSSVSSLSNLKSLAIEEIEDLKCLPDWFESLTSLEGLDIRRCYQLKDLCPGILYLTSLRRLTISDCLELEDTMHSVMWKALNGRLQSLTLLSFRNVEVLPEGIQHVASLQTLIILNWDSLTTVPEWIGNLTSLRGLEFWDCPNLASLPEGLTSLETLVIWECPILSKRCGEEWPKIAHIPKLYIIPDPNEESESATHEAQSKGPRKK